MFFEKKQKSELAFNEFECKVISSLTIPLADSLIDELRTYTCRSMHYRDWNRSLDQWNRPEEHKKIKDDDKKKNLKSFSCLGVCTHWNSFASFDGFYLRPVKITAPNTKTWREKKREAKRHWGKKLLKVTYMAFAVDWKLTRKRSLEVSQEGGWNESSLNCLLCKIQGANEMWNISACHGRRLSFLRSPSVGATLVYCDPR